MKSLMIGFGETLKIFFLTLLGSLPLGLIISLGSMCKFKPLQALVKIIVWIIRGTPLMLQLIIIYYGPGLLLQTNIWGTGSNGRMIATLVAFIINYACYFSEIYRGGIESIPKGQFEAAYSQGFGMMQTMTLIVLPQALRNIVPTLLSQMITTIKDSSYMASLVTVELMACTKLIISKANAYNGTWVDRFNRGTIHVTDVFVLFGFAFLAYFAINFTLSCLVRRMRGRRSR